MLTYTDSNSANHIKIGCKKIVRGLLYYKIFEDITKSYKEKVSTRRGLESQSNGTVLK